MEITAHTLEANVTTFTVSEFAGRGWIVTATYETLSWKRDRSACFASRIVAGPFPRKGIALAEANLLASEKVGNRVES